MNTLEEVKRLKDKIKRLERIRQKQDNKTIKKILKTLENNLK